MKTIIVLLLISFNILSQTYNVNVYLTNNTIIQGKLIKLSEKGIEIDPAGNVSFRFIKSESIDSVMITELNKILRYPIQLDSLSSFLPEDITSSEIGDNNTSKNSTDELFHISAGSNYFSTGGDYYTGFNTGFGINLATNLYFGSLTSKNRIFIGFEFGKGWISGEPMSFVFNGDVYNSKSSLTLNSYSLYVGRAWGLSSSQTSFNLLFGLTKLDHQVKIETEGISRTIDESKTSVRLGCGFLVDIATDIFISISLDYDAILGEEKKNETFITFYEPNKPKFTLLGGVFKAGIKLAYQL
ncbi:MAG: hypothetical protein L6Q59_14860 [Ignavibacteriaceae bacterium]|nr:hypothetical protein [Ignavibacteriaceae bacterium]